MHGWKHLRPLGLRCLRHLTQPVPEGDLHFLYYSVVKPFRGPVLLKILLGSVALISVVVVAGTIALRRYLPPDRLKELVVTQAQKTLGREVRLKDISLGLVGGLSVSGLEVSEKGGFPKGMFASVEAFSLKVAWLPLLRGKVVVDAVEVKGLQAKVVKLKSGTLSVDDLAGGAPAEKTPPAGSSAGGSLPIELSVRTARLSGGRLEYSDEAAGEKWVVSQLSAKADGFSTKDPFAAEFSLKADGGRPGAPVSAKLSFSGKLSLAGLDKEKLSVEIKSLEASALGWEASVSGRAGNALRPEADLTLALKTKGVELLKGGVKAAVNPGPPLSASAELDLRVPGFKAADLPLKGVPAGLVLPPTTVTGRVALVGEDLELKAFAIKAGQGEVELTGKVRKALTKPDPQVRISARLELPPLDSKQLSAFAAVPAGLNLPAVKIRLKASGGLDAADIQELAVHLGASVLSVAGRAQALSSGSPVVNLRVKGGPLALGELGAMHPAGKPFALSGGASVDMNIEGPADKPALRGTAKLEGLGAKAAGLELSGFTGSITADPSVIRLDSLAGDASGGRLTVSGTVSDYRREPDIRFKGRLTRLDLGRIFSAKGPVESSSGAAGKGPASGKDAPAPAPPAAQLPAAASRPIRTSGSFSIDEIVHPHLEGKDFSIDWGLTGVTPDFKSLNGTAGLRVKSGKFESMEAITQKSRLAKVLLMPLMIVQKVGKLGILKGMPDLSRVTFKEILGDYSFEQGVMTLKQSRLDSSAGDIASRGKVDLPQEKIEVAVTARVAGVLP